jgi:outer membrane lipoprotein-sorting protein
MKNFTMILLLLATVSLGCKQLGSLAGGGSGKVGGGDPTTEVVAASKKFIELKSFSAKMEGMGQTEIKQQIDYAAPDRYHVTYTAGPIPGMELIFIGNQSFMKTNGKWSRMPGDGSASMPTLRDSFTEEGLKTLSDARSEGEDTVDGKAAFVYSYKNKTPKGDFGFTCKMWVDKQSGLPLKIYATYDNGVLKNMTVNYDTQSKVTIEPPVS